MIVFPQKMEDTVRKLSGNERGEIKFLTIVLILGLAAVGYWGYVYIPVWMERTEARQECQKSLNRTWHHRKTGVTEEDVLRRVREIAEVEVEIGGEIKRIPAVDPIDLEVRYDQSFNPPILSIEFTYKRIVNLPLLDRDHEFDFHVYCERLAEH